MFRRFDGEWKSGARMGRAKSEKQLIRKAQSGDNVAFEHLVRKYQHMVFNLSYQMVNSPQLAEDVAQETFIRAWRSLSTYRSRAKFSTWLFRITKNSCLDVLRREKRHRKVTLISEIRNPGRAGATAGSGAEPCSGDTAELRELSESVTAAFKHLSYDLKMVIFLKDIGGYSYREIAEIIGCPIGTVMSRLSRARKVLLRELRVCLPEGGIKNEM